MNGPVISVIGTGHLGATHAACLAELGFQVHAFDTDEAKIEDLSRGVAPFFEPGLAPLLRAHLATGRLQFSTDLRDVVRKCDVHFICVGTPQASGSLAADTSAVTEAVRSIARFAQRPGLIVGKSTVPVGTAECLAAALDQASRSGRALDLAWNPEFLREGHAVADTLAPDRFVFGVRTESAEVRLRRIYERAINAGTPTIVTDLTSAQLVKMAANSFLATKISFINAVSEMCDAVGADVLDVAVALGLDARIGTGALRPGLGFGGGCIPKDTRAFAHRAAEAGVVDMAALLRRVDAINMRCRMRIVELASQLTDGLAERTVTLLGASFKAGSDDIRDSPALALANAILDEGGQVRIFDPVASANIPFVQPFLHCSDTLEAAVADSDLLIVCTEWGDFADIDPFELSRHVRHPRVIDARHILDADQWRDAGWLYRAPGRPTADREIRTKRTAPSFPLTVTGLS